MKGRARIQRLLRPHGKDAFVAALPTGARVFDIGCGNRSPERIKALRPDLYYVGIDVVDYKQNYHSLRLANEYRITTPELFPSAIAQENGTMDAVISSHNLEHCDDPDQVLQCMAGALNNHGKLYLCFPCEASVTFPSRRGTLRFSDDPTHHAPPSWLRVLDQLATYGMTTVFAARRYRPWIAASLGATLEPFSAVSQRVLPFGLTWAAWGFESVIWAKRTGSKEQV